MSRPDISPSLVHFTSGTDEADAFARLRKIIASRKLVAGSGFIKGEHRCVCFSEAPLTSLTGGLVNEDYYSRYSPFGIVVSKKWLFEQGGRPVIYQPSNEYDLLPESHQWRHVRYELRESFENADFTWEREWRIKCDELPFTPATAKIVVADKSWAQRLIGEHDAEESYKVQQYSVIFDQSIAEAYRERYEWTVVPLR